MLFVFQLVEASSAIVTFQDVLREPLLCSREGKLVELRRQGKVADSDVLVRLLEVVAPIFSCGTPKQAESIVSVINDVLCDEAVLPWDVSCAMSMEDRSTFAPLFSALLHLVRTSRSRAVLPFVEQHLLKVTLPV